MRIGELARQADMNLATVKYYLREGLLHPGERTSVNQAIYDNTHRERLKLIRALTQVAGLPLEKVHQVIEALNSQSSLPQTVENTHDALLGSRGAEPDFHNEAAAKLLQVVELQGWKCRLRSPAFKAAADALEALMSENLPMPTARLNRYATAADAIGRTDFEDVSILSSQARTIVLSMILRQPLLDALILLAQEHYSQEDKNKPL